MEFVRSESGVRSEKIAAPVAPAIARTKRLQVWFIRVCSSILVWTCLVQILTVGKLWHPSFINITAPSVKHPPPPLLPLSKSEKNILFFRLYFCRDFFLTFKLLKKVEIWDSEFLLGLGNS